ncbi:MAG TPA: hypothetical protein VEM57_04735 [Candidatus Binatus sp.]|nr:hypothetical protein [Candidatus Binatus sp.]
MMVIFRAAVLALLVALFPAAGLAVTVGDIVSAPESYAGQQVTVTGTVTEQSIGYRGETVYTIGAGDRRITVFGYGAAPAAGEHIEVSAKVGWKAPDEEFTWPPVLVESSRRPAP